MASLNSSTSPPSDTYELTIVVNGLDDEYEVAVNDEVWPNNKKSFLAGTILQNLIITVVGYDIDPPIVAEVVMDANKTLTFEATAMPPGFIQSSKIMFTSDGQYREDVNWNTIEQGVTNSALINNSGVSIPWTITIPSTPDWDIDAQATNSGYEEFTPISLERAVYTYGVGDVKVITLNGLDSTKVYKLTVASLIGYDEDIQHTLVTVDSITKELANNVGLTPFHQEFDFSLVSSMNISVTTKAGSSYASISAMILEEYTS